MKALFCIPALFLVLVFVLRAAYGPLVANLYCIGMIILVIAAFRRNMGLSPIPIPRMFRRP